MKLALHWQILIAFIIAVVFGIAFPEKVKYVSWMGDLFLRALKMIIVPIVLTSVISGVANIGDAGNLGKLGIKTLSYYIISSLLAILTGLILVNLIKPGIGADLGLNQSAEDLKIATENFGSTLINIIPTNIFSAFSSGDMLAIIFFSILSGYFITKLKSESRTKLIGLINAGFELIMKVTSFIIAFAPLGIFGIVASVVAQQAADAAALAQTASRLGIYMITVASGLIFHAFITLPLILKLFGVPPFKHFRALSAPLLTAFSTSSSSATLPLTIKAVEEKAGVSNKVTSFVVPLGATVNMDGTALYECVAVMFISQAYGVHLDFIQQMVVVFTALLASIGAAGIPMAGLVMMSVVLSAVGLPLEGIGLILAVDRILDMMRTTVNVWSDACGVAIVARTEGEKLKYHL